MKQKIQSFRTRTKYTNAYLKNKVRDNVILYESFHGALMTGNVYAMFQKLVRMEERNFIHVWAVKNLAKFDKRGYDQFPNVIFVEYYSNKYLQYLTSAKYLINDTTFPSFFIKKDDQMYLNTWHGTPLKSLGKDVKGNPSEHKNMQRNLLHADYLAMPNAYTANILIDCLDMRGIYAGKIIEEGYPRIDATYQTDRTTFLQDVLGQELQIDLDKKIVLYAPTWRGATGGSLNIIETLADIVEQIKTTLPNTHQLLVKVHPLTYKFLAAAPELKKICVPDKIDANELLSVVDILITDYSSIFFDFYVMKKPIILFAYDYHEYMSARGMYLDIQTLDVDVAFTMRTFLEMLSTATQRKEPMNYDAAIAKYAYKNLDGKTTDRYIDIIFNDNAAAYNVYSIKNAKKTIVVYSGGMLNNGVTSSFLNLTHTIDYDKFNVILLTHDYANLDEERINRLRQVNKQTKIVYRDTKMDVTKTEFVFYMYSNRKYNEQWIKKLNIAAIYQREFKRLFGKSEIDVVIDYSGYSPFWAQLFAYCSAPQKIIYLHSHMWEEMERKLDAKATNKARLAIIFNLYKNFNVLACVGDKSMEANKASLASFVSVDKFQYLPNSLNAKSIIEKANALFPAPRADNTVFVTVGRLSPEKGHLQLIEAFEKLLRERPEYQQKVQVYIIGKGWLQTKLQKKIDDYGLNDHIILTGHLENPFPLMQKSNCYIASSHYEGQSLVLLEALVLKKDIIATNNDGHRGVLGEKYVGLVDNSVEGLYYGIVRYLEKKYIETEQIDIATYERQAKQAFERACGITEERRQ